MDKIRLFCFPYAGGSAVIFNGWKQLVHPRIDIRPVELAGRGQRIREPLYENVAALVDDLFRQLSKEGWTVPYALFGHSLGSLICHELLKKIRMKGLPLPVHIFFSGRGAPQIQRPDRKKYHLMDDGRFRKEILELGGTPPEFFEHSELLELFLPMLKNDFRLAEQDADENIRPVDCEITVLLGKEDDLTPEQCDGWKSYTTRVCRMFYFEGGHFFLHRQAPAIAELINRALILNEPVLSYR